MRKHLFNSLGVLVVSTIGMFGQTPDWKEYEYGNDGFAITSPFMPTVESQMVKTEAGELEMHYYSINAGLLRSLSVGVVDFKRFGDLPVRQLLQAAKNGSAAEAKGQVTSEKEISLEGTVGIEYEISAEYHHALARCYAVGGRMISLVSVAPSEFPFFPGTERFFNSLRFIPPWKEYQYDGDGFAFSAPAKPSLQTNFVDTSVGRVEMHLYKIDLGDDTGIMVTVTDYGNRTKISTEVLQRVKETTLAQVNGKVLSEKSISLDKNPGIDFELMGSDGYHARSRYYIIGTRLVGLVSYAGQEKPLPADTTRILDSLRLLNSL